MPPLPTSDQLEKDPQRRDLVRGEAGTAAAQPHQAHQRKDLSLEEVEGEVLVEEEKVEVEEERVGRAEDICCQR